LPIPTWRNFYFEEVFFTGINAVNQMMEQPFIKIDSVFILLLLLVVAMVFISRSTA
jgi:hypothetical protein